LLGHKGDDWRIEPLNLLSQLDTARSPLLADAPDDIRITLYQAFVHSERNNAMHKIVQRLLCLAFSRFHVRNTATHDIVSLITNHEMSHGQSVASIKTRVNSMMKRGHIWEDIVECCDEQAGVVLLLGKGYL